MEDEKRQTSRVPDGPLNIRFGPYVLDLRSAEPRKNDLRIRLQEQPFQILVALLERPGEVVLREEIRHRLWPDKTVVEFDHSINAAVKRLRDTLLDSTEKPRYIETLARRGYRFVAQVRTESAASAQSLMDGDSSSLSVPAVFETQRPPVAEPESPIVSDVPMTQLSAAGGKTKLVWAGLPVLGVLLVTGLTMWYFATSKKPHRDDPPGVPVPLTTYAGFQSFPTFSPEGARVAFAWDASGMGQSGIYVKLIGSPEPLRLTSSDKGDFAPAWSPDGRSVAFLRVRGPLLCDVVLVPSLVDPSEM